MEWTPVENGMPQEKEIFLFTGQVKIGKRTSNRVFSALYSPETGKVTITGGEVKNVTAWMPHPEPCEIGNMTGTEWTPEVKKSPHISGEYLVTREARSDRAKAVLRAAGNVATYYFDAFWNQFEGLDKDFWVVAWMPLPKPYNADKHPKWIVTNKHWEWDHVGPRAWFKELKCSECWNQARGYAEEYDRGYKFPRYCSECGAKMENGGEQP